MDQDLPAWLRWKIESETRAAEQATKAGAVATAAMHDYGRAVLEEARARLPRDQRQLHRVDL